MIIYENEKPRYFDKHGKEITDGCTIRYADGHIKKVYLTADGKLGTDATNPKWIASGRAFPCEYGIYLLGGFETDEVEVVEENQQNRTESLDNQSIFDTLADIEQKLFYAATFTQDETYKEAHKAAKAALEAFAKATGCHN